MHVSSRNMFPTTRNLQIRVHVSHSRHYCGDWLTFGCFVPMIADHNLVKKSFGLQMVCAWHKIWTLSGRLLLMRNVQLMKIYIYIYIMCVLHMNNKCSLFHFNASSNMTIIGNYLTECEQNSSFKTHLFIWKSFQIS
jgi:hypothetical protein